MDDEDIRAFVGAEHFPSCPCFDRQDSPCPDEMYVIAQECAQQMMTGMMNAGFCAKTSPYLIGMAADMMIATVASIMVARAHPELDNTDVTPQTSMEFAEECRRLHDEVRARLVALEKRGGQNCAKYAGGSASVQ